MSKLQLTTTYWYFFNVINGYIRCMGTTTSVRKM